MQRLCVLFVSLVLLTGVAVSPVCAGGDKVQGDYSVQGPDQGDTGNGASPGDDAMGNQV